MAGYPVSITNTIPGVNMLLPPTFYPHVDTRHLPHPRPAKSSQGQALYAVLGALLTLGLGWHTMMRAPFHFR